MHHTLSMRALVLAAALMASGCATLEPEPCTPEWADYQAEQILTPFARKYRSEISTLRNLADDLENPDVLTTFKLIGQADQIAYMFEDFTETAYPRIQAALSQCATPDKASALLVGLLEREGVEPRVIAWIEALGILVDAHTAASSDAR